MACVARPDGATSDDKAAMAAAAALGATLTAGLRVDDAAGLAAKAAVDDFAATAARLDALMEDSSDDEELQVSGKRKYDESSLWPHASELISNHLERPLPGWPWTWVFGQASTPA
eukprot:TRINITY_DN29831_c0_g2_i2.p1 TRINITY_DN29831_c0_g2~~TRINITY_DN29831_c0_g2_i2.p1  ORF type:complete len:135 (+),score=21.69 TRINITY_DN29831_c0_g2_i2:63-407(+)